MKKEMSTAEFAEIAERFLAKGQKHESFDE
jgi:hypothetical protein